MPIKKNQSHSEIVSELMSSYDKTGRIGNTSPRNRDHAEDIANAIAYKTRHERILDSIKLVNRTEDSLDYSDEMIQANLQELQSLISKFKERYLHNEFYRFKAGDVQMDFDYSPDFLIYDEFSGKSIPVGYRCPLNSLNLNSAKDSLVSSPNFDALITDFNFIIRPKTRLLDRLNGKVANLIFTERI